MADAQIAPVSFSTTEDKSSSALNGSMPQVTNVIVDSGGAVRARPGISAWGTFPGAAISGSPVIGMTSFGDWLVYVTADRRIHALSSGGVLLELSSSDPLTLLDGGGRPSFVAGRDMLCIAGGGAIQKWLGGGLSARLQNVGNGTDADNGGPPPEATHISGIAGSLLAKVNDASGQVWYSGTPMGAWENWDLTATGGAGYFQAEARPDPLVSMSDNTNEVFCFGATTIQVFDPSQLSIDPSTVDTTTANTNAFLPNRTMNLGIQAADAVVAVDDNFAILERQRRFVITDARTYNDISKSIATLIRSLQRVDDAWGFRLRFGRFDCVVWIFPTDGYGLIWDSASGNWSEWRAWNVGPQPVAITSVYNWAEQDVYLVGLSNGQIAVFDDGTTTDLGSPIDIMLISGFTNHGVLALKASNALMLTFKRTWSAAPTSGHVRISCRDYEGAWRILRDVQLSTTPFPVVALRSLGNYRIRQYKIEYTGSDELQLVSAQEEYEILEA